MGSIIAPHYACRAVQRAVSSAICHYECHVSIRGAVFSLSLRDCDLRSRRAASVHPARHPGIDRFITRARGDIVTGAPWKSQIELNDSYNFGIFRDPVGAPPTRSGHGAFICWAKQF